MNNPKFKIGDVVNIKSDKTVKMTVDEVITQTHDGKPIFKGNYACIWFDCTFEIRKDVFKEETLEVSN